MAASEVHMNPVLGQAPTLPLAPDTGQRRWLVVVGACLALTAGASPMVVVVFGVLMPVILADTGWSRGGASLALVAFTFVGAAAMPLFGRLIDRLGLYRTVATGIALFALAMVLLSRSGGDLTRFIILYGLLGLLGTSLTMLPYAKVITETFDRRRGIALGIAMAGTGLGSIVMPMLAHVMIAAFGWRTSYALFGLIALVIGWLSLAIMAAGDRRGRVGPKGADNLSVAQGPIASGRMSDNRLLFMKLAVMLLFASIALNGVVPHLGAITRDLHGSDAMAATLLALLGASSLISRVAAGWLLDRWTAAAVGTLFFTLPILSAILVLMGVSRGWLPLVAIGFGAGLGGEVDLMGYLVGRYFGAKRYGEIYGWLMALFTIGAGVGAWVMGLSWDLTGSYSNALIGFIAALVAAIALLNALGPYNRPPPRPS